MNDRPLNLRYSVRQCRCYPIQKEDKNTYAMSCGACKTVTLRKEKDLYATLVHETLHFVGWNRLPFEEMVGLNDLLDGTGPFRDRVEKLVCRPAPKLKSSACIEEKK